MRTRLRQFVVSAVALFTASAVLPSATAADGDRAGGQRPSHGGLSAVIRYTEYGIPHIVAKDYANLGFGAGWAQAADQVCVLADGFVTLRGERSRWFGAEGTTDFALSSARSNLSSDLYFRGVRETRTVEKLLAEPAPVGPSRKARDMMRGWAAGYNAWLKQNQINDPACTDASWVTPVTELDVAARGLAIAALSGEGRLVEAITTAQPPTGVNSPASRAAGAKAVMGAADDLWGTSDMGSNAVAFRGDTTANGRGLLLGNPHYPWQGGRRFWQSQQTIPGRLDVSGGALLGSPAISIGFNAHVAWSHTVSTGVPANFHQLTLDPADPTTYLVDGEPEKMTRRTMTVAVKDGTPVTRTQWWTRYGPVVNALGAQAPLPWTTTTAYALHDPNATNLRFADTSLGFSEARSTDDVLDSLAEHQGIPWVNTLAADRAGHTLFTQSQVLPRITDDLAERCSTALGRTTYPASGVAILDGSRGDCALGRDADAVRPGIFGPARMPTLKDAPYVENS
ncbi:penicillin acylase family protein, partial [Streptomyces tailanensis]|uniref:penicillin acylase family protein n=1 Tax=Streptomyces tailanensis TaxID=2569858 RepID=UPI00155B1092